MRIYPAETGAGGRGEEQKDRKSAAESACREEKSDGGSFFSMRGTGAQTAFVGCRKRRTEARGKAALLPAHPAARTCGLPCGNGFLPAVRGSGGRRLIGFGRQCFLLSVCAEQARKLPSRAAGSAGQRHGESGFASGSSGSLDLRFTLRERFSSGGARVRRTPPLYRLRTTAFSSFRMRGTGAQAAFAGCRPRRAEAEIQNRAGRRRESR